MDNDNEFNGCLDASDDDYILDFNYDDHPEFTAFMENLRVDLDNWRQKTKIRIMNPEKYAAFKNSFEGLVRIFQKDNPTAEISYKLNDSFDTGMVSISIVSYSINIDDTKGFINALTNSVGIELFGSNKQNKICMTVTFKTIYKDLFIGDSN